MRTIITTNARAPRVLGALLAGALWWMACSSSTPTSPSTVPAPEPDAQQPFAAELIEVGQAYASFQQVDYLLHIAPLDCKIPPPPEPTFSQADDGPHELKLYHLFARDAGGYLNLSSDAEGAVSKVGQAVVKETFHAVQDDDGPIAAKDGQRYKKGERGPLFVMLKVEQQEGTDQGWVYGVLSADGQTVQNSGVIESCAGCHEQAHYGRLFGPQL